MTTCYIKEVKSQQFGCLSSTFKQMINDELMHITFCFQYPLVNICWKCSKGFQFI